MVFDKKIIENQLVLKMLFLSSIYPFFNVCYDFKILDAVKYSFLQVKNPY